TAAAPGGAYDSWTSPPAISVSQDLIVMPLLYEPEPARDRHTILVSEEFTSATPAAHLHAPGADLPGATGSETDPAARAVGVGPWTGEWPTQEHYDPELLATGDRRNVVDEYRYWTLESIV